MEISVDMFQLNQFDCLIDAMSLLMNPTESFYEQNYTVGWDWNNSILLLKQIMTELYGIDCRIQLTVVFSSEKPTEKKPFSTWIRFSGENLIYYEHDLFGEFHGNQWFSDCGRWTNLKWTKIRAENSYEMGLICWHSWLWGTFRCQRNT